MSLSFQTSIVLIIAVAAGAAAFAYYVYRRTVPVVSRRQQWLLIVLRSSALTLTLLSLFEPLLVLTSSSEQLPSVAVLVDRSLSMSQKDKGGDRGELVKSLLRRESFSRLTEASNLQLQQFAHDLLPLHRDSLTMNGGATDISGAIQSALKNSPSQLQSIILITDGNYNAGSNPLYEAERTRIPIFTIGVGDTVEQRDIGVSKLTVNTVGYVESAIPVDAVVRVSGMEQVTATVTLREEGKRIEEKQVTIPSSLRSVAEVPVRFSYLPRAEGMKKISVSVSPQAEEITEKNNTRSAMVKILKNKMQVTVIAGAASPDVAAVLQTLHADQNISAALFVQMPNGELMSRTNAPLPQSLTTTDCLLLIGFPTAQSSGSVVHTIVEKAKERSLSVMFIAGRLIDPQKTKMLEPILPVSVVSPRIDEQSILPALIPQHRYHALVHIDAEKFPLFRWDKFPPAYASFQTFSSKPEAQTLLSVKIQGVTLQNPLLVVRNVAGTKSLAMTGYGINRWKTLAAASPDTRGVFDVWLASMVRWLATRNDDSPFKVEPTKEFFSQGEPIAFTAQLYNENFQPLDNADLPLAIRTLTGEQAATVSLPSIGSGRYEGYAPPLAQGEYVYSAHSLIGGDTVGSTSGRFSVGEQSVEFAETKMNKPMLEQIAEKSGGTYADAAQADSLFASIVSRPDMQPQERITTSEWELWNLPLFLSLIITLFAVEWFLRKRWGML